MAATLPVLEYNLVCYRRTWRGSALSSFVLPVLFVLGFGVSVGSMVNTASLGESYLSYLVPGMIASTAMQIAFGEATYPVMAKFRWMRTYHSMYAAPVSVGSIISGDMIFVTLRVVSSTTVFLAVTAAFGGVHSWWSLLVPLIAALVGIAFAAPTYALAATAEDANAFAYLQRFAIIPMSLFSGVFYPVTLLPSLLRYVAYASPLWHGVQLCRAATHTDHGGLGAIAVHTGYLLLWAGAGMVLVVRAFRRRLSD